MQNAAFGASGVDGIYVALDVPPDRLPRALEGLHAAGFAGLNLTLPHKEAGARLCARLTPEAERAGAVNTLRRESAGWLGHATDGAGFRGWIEECGVRVKGGRVLLLGAGGAARCVAPEVVALGASALTVVSRNGGHAQALIARLRLSETGPTALTARPLDDTRAARGSEGFDLLVRALSAEGVGVPEAAWWSAVAPSAPVLDLNYGERADATRERARSEGRRFEDGLGLLVHQGAASFEFWTGARAPIAVMREALRAR
jgi:shikimate dehydrogenase